MISVKKCRELLGEQSLPLSDGQIISLRNQLYLLANVVVDVMRNGNLVQVVMPRGPVGITGGRRRY